MTEASPTADPNRRGTTPDAPASEWARGYAAAQRYYRDDAPIALDKIRGLLDDAAAAGAWYGHVDKDGTAYSGDPIGYFYEDLTSILDTVKEPK